MPRPQDSNIERRRRIAVKNGITTFATDFSHICKERPDRIGIVAEGDSWFAYPRKWIAFGADINIIHHLENKISGTDTTNLLRLASNGDEAVDMTSGNQFKTLYKILKKNQDHIKLLLFSGGGNDIVGKNDMLPLLNDFEEGMSSLECINIERFENRLSSIILAYRRLIAMCEDMVPSAKIVSHTYDIAKPVNQGAEFFWGLIKTKPWVYPYMVKKNIPPHLHLPIIEYMLENFGEKLISLSEEKDIKDRLIVVNTQRTLRPGAKQDWLNEIHPTETGFKKIHNKIYKILRDLESGLPA